MNNIDRALLEKLVEIRFFYRLVKFHRRMMLAKVNCKLMDPFPTGSLPLVDIGSMDGHRDSLIEEGFVLTKSVEKFLLDKHSVIIGPFGSGKSALYNLLRNNSEVLETYQDDFIVTIDEQVRFDEIKSSSHLYFPSMPEKLTYQLLWKFQVCRRISEEIALLDNFPQSKEEEYIQEFLHRTGGVGGGLSITKRIKSLFDKFTLKIKSKLSDIPVDVELSKQSEKVRQQIAVNLDEAVSKISHIINGRNIRKCIVSVDKLDKFVAGEEYDTQRAYIESLLELEDDMYGIDEIGFKIFLRSDLYERLDFSSLGPDKAEDNTLRLVWSKEEIRKFIARRLFLALYHADIWTLRDILESSDMSDYHLRWYEKA